MNFYEYVYVALNTLVESDINANNIFTILQSQDKSIIDLGKIISTNIILLDSELTLNDVFRVSTLEQRHMHVIICELKDDFISRFYTDADSEERLISVSSMNYKDEVFTILYTERLSNKERVTYDLIVAIYNVTTNEFKNHILSIGMNEFVLQDQDFARLTYVYSQVYIPAIICYRNGVDNESLTNPSITQFINYLNTDGINQGIDSLFDRCGINYLKGEGYEKILFLEDNDDISDEEIDIFNDDIDIPDSEEIEDD